jgi:hypothetical protein
VPSNPDLAVPSERGAAVDNPFDVFRKEKDGTLVWIAAVGQLHTAAALVAELSEKYPGEYRVFDKRTGEIISSHEALRTVRGTLH